MKNEVLIAENVEVDMETLATAQSHRAHPITRTGALYDIWNAVIEALGPEDRKRLEEYRKQ